MVEAEGARSEASAVDEIRPLPDDGLGVGVGEVRLEAGLQSVVTG